MEYADWLKNQQWFDPEKINHKQLDELESQAKKLLRERDYQEVTNLLEEYRDSYEAVHIIGSQIPFWDMIHSSGHCRQTYSRNDGKFKENLLPKGSKRSTCFCSYSKAIQYSGKTCYAHIHVALSFTKTS